MNKKLLALLALSVVVAFSCNKQPQEEPEPDALVVATTTYSVAKGDGSLEIPVSANVALKVTVETAAAEWLYFDKVKAMVDSKVIIGYRANSTPRPRSGKVTISGAALSEVVQINQAAGDATVSLESDKIKVNPKGETFSVKFTSNDEVNVSAPSWIRVKSVENNEQTLEATMNDTGAAREGEVVFSAASDANTKAVFTVVQNAANLDPNAISILALGNDATVDAMQYLYPILKGMGYTTIRLANLYIGNSDLAKHVSSIADTNKVYKINYIKDGAWVTSVDTSAVKVLEPDDWDVIVLSETPDNASKAAKYETIPALVKAVRKACPFVPFAWNMGWAQKGKADQYEEIVDAVSTLKGNTDIPTIIPAGTAVQNMRTTFIEDNITRSDNKNLSYNIGRPVAAYTWAAAITGKSIDALAYVPDDKNDKNELKYQYEVDYLPAIKEAVNAAIAKPFEVTASAAYAPIVSKVDMNVLKQGMAALGYPEAMLSEYVEAPMTMIHNAYYNSSASQGSTVAADSPANLCAGFCGHKGETLNKFVCTHIFTKAQIPVGTIIVLLDSKLQVRPEGWKTLSTANDGKDGRPSRPANVTNAVTVTDAAWWGDFTYRAFNISKTDGKVFTADEWANVHKSFAILIPKNAVGGGLEDYGNGEWNW